MEILSFIQDKFKSLMHPVSIHTLFDHKDALLYGTKILNHLNRKLTLELLA